MAIPGQLDLQPNLLPDPSALTGSLVHACGFSHYAPRRACNHPGGNVVLTNIQSLLKVMDRRKPGIAAPADMSAVDVAMSIIESRGPAAAAQYLVERDVPIPVIARLLEERRLGLGARMRTGGEHKQAPQEPGHPLQAEGAVETDKTR